MMTFAKRSIVTASALLAPLLVAAPANANSVDRVGLVNQTAVNEFSSSLKMTLDANDLLSKGNVSQAKVKLDTALAKMQMALRKDATLGVGTVKGQDLHADLKNFRETLGSSDRFEAASNFNAIIARAGMN